MKSEVPSKPLIFMKPSTSYLVEGNGPIQVICLCFLFLYVICCDLYYSKVVYRIYLNFKIYLIAKCDFFPLLLVDNNSTVINLNHLTINF